MSDPEEAIVRAAVDDGLHEQILLRYRRMVDDRIQAGETDVIDIALEVRRQLLDELSVKAINGTAVASK